MGNREVREMSKHEKRQQKSKEIKQYAAKASKTFSREHKMSEDVDVKTDTEPFKKVR